MVLLWGEGHLGSKMVQTQLLYKFMDAYWLVLTFLSICALLPSSVHFQLQLQVYYQCSCYLKQPERPTNPEKHQKRFNCCFFWLDMGLLTIPGHAEP